MRRERVGVGFGVTKEGDTDGSQRGDEGLRAKEKKYYGRGQLKRKTQNKWTGRWDVLSISFRQGAKQSARAAHH